MLGLMAGNQIKLTFAGDSKSLERAMDAVGDGAREMADDLDAAGKDAGRFGGAVTGMNDKIDNAEGKFMAAADLADGLATSLGLNIGPAIEMSRAFGDMAGGFTGLVAPALEKMSGRFGNLTFVTKAQTMATTALNTVMRANPILLVVTALVALTAGLVIAYNKSETFRNIVNGAFNAVKNTAQSVTKAVTGFFDNLWDSVMAGARGLGKIAELITAPYRLAFRAIASLWNNSVGKLSVSIPGFMGFGGISFDVPDIPQLANGGIARSGRPHIVGERGPELFIPGQTGTVVPNGQYGGADVRVMFDRGAGDALIGFMRAEIRHRGGNVQTVLGAA